VLHLQAGRSKLCGQNVHIPSGRELVGKMSRSRAGASGKSLIKMIKLSGGQIARPKKHSGMLALDASPGGFAGEKRAEFPPGQTGHPHNRGGGFYGDQLPVSRLFSFVGKASDKMSEAGNQVGKLSTWKHGGCRCWFHRRRFQGVPFRNSDYSNHYLTF
jgi:hypothetical protein